MHDDGLCCPVKVNDRTERVTHNNVRKHTSSTKVQVHVVEGTLLY